MENVLLSVSDLSIHRGKEEAVRSSSFSVYEGAITALVGESGSGKSMTALAIAGLLPSGFTASGSIIFDGRELLSDDVDMASIRGRGIALMLQDAAEALNPVYRIGQQIRTVLKINGLECTDESVRTLLSDAGIAEAFDEYPHELSGGMRQRALAAFAMAPSPRLLIADEITSSLDDENAHMIMRLIMRMAEERKSSVLMITHDLSLASRYASRIAVMHGGQTVEEGDVSAVADFPKHPYTELLLRSSEFARDCSGKLFSIPGRMPLPREEVPGCSFASRCPYCEDGCFKEIGLKSSGSHIWRCIRG